MGPAPTVTVPSWDPRDQLHWLAALRRQEWVRDIRVDGRANLLTVARLLALHAGWETLESRPTWERLVFRSGLSERTVARWLQELRVRGWLAHIERGSTPAHRPMVLAHLSGNRAAVYGLRIPLTPAEAVNRALEQLVMRLAAELVDQAAAGNGAAANPDRCPGAEPDASSTRPVPACPGDSAVTAADRTPPSLPDQQQSPAAGDTNGSLTEFGSLFKDSGVRGYARASAAVDTLGTNPVDPTKPGHHPTDPGKGNDQRTALRAGSEANSWQDWALTVPTSGFAMLIAADWLRRRLPVFARCSRKLTRHLCQPYWSAGWCNRDILHAMDHRPGLFSQAAGVPVICPDHIAAPQVFIRSRLAAWRSTEGMIVPGYWSSLVADVADAKAARRRVAARHGKAGAALLRPGERALTAQRITDHGRAARPPASPATRAAAQATLGAALAERRAALATVRGLAHNGTATGDSELNPAASPPTAVPMWVGSRMR